MITACDPVTDEALSTHEPSAGKARRPRGMGVKTIAPCVRPEGATPADLNALTHREGAP